MLSNPTHASQLQLVAHQLVLLAEVQLAACDDRMRPAFPLLVLRLEGSQEFIGFFVGVDQGDGAVLVAENELVVDFGDSGRALAWRSDLASPTDLARRQMHADGN